ncbi:HD-GYP domain-containing protein [Paenibacillus humicola]|uniref:HD-GYP domain-containing protein n=1 Tax=Paenibacillus humicola TaxID=3110540 RepID=UPI00237C314D|nr:HD-GYP domain-containing protein [Paenibacillus humicola]
MATVAVSQVKPGDKIVEDVLTPLGGILFRKGIVITPRELEILRAFLIPAVTVDTSDKRDTKAAGDVSKSPLMEQYDETVALLKSVFTPTVSGSDFPTLDIRNQLNKLLQYIDEYKMLTFTVPSMGGDYLVHKSVMSAMSCYLLAQWNGFPKKDWMQAALAGLLHDIGNVKLDKSILNKPSALTAEEAEEMKRHTVLGYQLLKNVTAINEGVKLAALQHHERIDGSGYPMGVGAEKIHPYAKLTAISDIFHSMTMERRYRRAASPYLVLEQIHQDSFGKLEPSYVQTFIEKATQFHHGAFVRLSDYRVGEIIFSDRSHPTRPWVSVNGTIVNLTTERQLFIQEILGDLNPKRKG